MVLPIIGGALQFLGRKYVQSRIMPIKAANDGEDMVIEEMRNPQSPMFKPVEEWTEGDRFRAEHSPSYNSNYYLQEKVKQYEENIYNKYLQDWRERDKMQGKIW